MTDRLVPGLSGPSFRNRKKFLSGSMGSQPPKHNVLKIVFLMMVL